MCNCSLRAVIDKELLRVGELEKSNKLLLERTEAIYAVCGSVERKHTVQTNIKNAILKLQVYAVNLRKLLIEAQMQDGL